MKLKELLTPRRKLTNEKIIKYINECIEELRKLGYEINNDIEFYEGEGTGTFGSISLPQYGYEYPFILVLNKYMFNEPEEAIKNTIYHELAHYIHMNNYIGNDYIFYDYDKGKWFIRKNLYGVEPYKGHGKEWKKIADNISNKLGIKISRTDDYETHTGVGQQYEEKVRYIVRCKHCGQELKYMKKTEFVKDPNVKIPGKDKYKWRCGNCNTSGEFEVIEVKK